MRANEGDRGMRTYEWREQMVVGESRGAVVSAPGADTGADTQRRDGGEYRTKIEWTRPR